jgi:desulfoferrodoxin (superoxide reductase-like protein)
VTITSGELDITVRVNMKNPDGSHYIEKIGILEGDKKILAVKEFTFQDKIYIAKFSSSILPKNRDKIKVFSRCVLHDVWTAPLKDSKSK